MEQVLFIQENTRLPYQTAGVECGKKDEAVLVGVLCERTRSIWIMGVRLDEIHL